MSENLNLSVKKNIIFSIKLAAVMIGSALLLSLARKEGLIDHELVVRLNSVVIGLALAVFFNVMPKMQNGPPPVSIHDATLAQALVRFSSWTMTLAFLAWAALWAFTPQKFANIGSMAAVGASVAAIFCYTVLKLVTWRASKNA